MTKVFLGKLVRHVYNSRKEIAKSALIALLCAAALAMSGGGAWAAAANGWSNGADGLKDLIEAGDSSITITGTIDADSAADFQNAAASVTITGPGTISGLTADFFNVPAGKQLILNNITLALTTGGIKADGGAITISGGTVNASGANGINAVNNGTINVNSAATTLSANANVINLSDATGTIAFSGGTLESRSTGSLTVSNGTLNITGTAVTASATRAINISGGAVTMTTPGNITATLDNGISVSNGTVMINGNTQISATGTGPALEVTGGTVSVTGMTLKGYAVNTSGSNTSFTNVTISDNGTATTPRTPTTVIVSTGTTTFTNGSLIRNAGSTTTPTIDAGGTKFTFSGTQFTGNEGTAVKANASEVVFTNTAFNANDDIAGSNGGTINIASGKVYVNNSRFGESNANRSDPVINLVAGDLFFDDPNQAGAAASTFTKNEKTSVRIAGGNNKFNKTIFTSNPSEKVIEITGGTTEFSAVNVSSNNGSSPAPVPDTRTVLNISNGRAIISDGSTFNTNGIRSIFMNTNTPTVDLTSAKFTNNTNGAIWLAAGTLNVIEAEFDNNGKLDALKGGAILVEGTTENSRGGTLNLKTGQSEKKFTNNKATNGGAIYVVGDFTTIESNSSALFEGNQANEQGGAIFQYGDTGRVILPAGAAFKNNSAKTGGGAVYVSSTADGSCSVNGSTFENNTTTGSNGGAIYTNGRITLSSGHFESNTAPNGWGGAVYSSKPKDRNYTVSVSGGTFIKNSAVQGGAIFAGENSTSGGLVRVTGGTFGGRPDTVMLEPGNTATFVGKGGGGGAIWGDPVEIIGSATSPVTFLYNRAGSGDGGAVYSSPSDVASLSTNTVISYAVFYGNEAKEGGGAIRMNCAGSIEQVLFKSNRTTGDAGGALHLSANTTIRNVSFVKNSSATQAGAIRLPLEATNTTIGITNSYFVGNRAENDGGALYNTGNMQTVTVHRSFFEGNSSGGVKGGAISIAGGTFQLTQSTFIGNSVGASGATTASGGALNCGATSFRIANCTVYGNSSTGDGGGFYFTGAAGTSDVNSAMVYTTIVKNSAVGNGGGFYTNAQDITFGANIVIGNSANRYGSDTFRQNSLTTRGYNVIGNHGGYVGGSATGNVDWSGDDEISPSTTRTNSDIEKQSSNFTIEQLFGAVDAAPAINNEDLIAGGYSLVLERAGSTSITDPDGADRTFSNLTTLRLIDETTNPARGILPSTRSFYRNFFATGANPSAQSGYSTDQDERGVLRGVFSTGTTPGSGSKIDAGAFQTIGPRGGDDDPNKITKVEMGGMTNQIMSPGQVITLHIIAYKNNGTTPADIVEDPQLAWSSSHPDIAYVDQRGNLTVLRAPTIGMVEVTITAIAVNNPQARSTRTFTVRYRPTHTNIPKAVWSEWFGNINPLNNASEFFGDLSQSAANTFANFYSNIYGVPASVVTDLSNESMGVALTPGTYNGTSMQLRSSMHVSMSTLKDPGSLIPMEYTYTFSEGEIDEIIANAANRGALSAGEVGAELFKTVNLSFTGEDGNTIVLVDNGSNGVSFANAVANGIIKWQKFGDKYRLDLSAFIADATSANNQVNLWNRNLVIADNSANGKIYGTVHLLDTSKRSSPTQPSVPGGSGGGGGSSSGSGSGGGCSVASLSALAIIMLLKRKKN